MDRPRAAERVEVEARVERRHKARIPEWNDTEESPGEDTTACVRSISNDGSLHYSTGVSRHHTLFPVPFLFLPFSSLALSLSLLFLFRSLLAYAPCPGLGGREVEQREAVPRVPLGLAEEVDPEEVRGPRGQALLGCVCGSMLEERVDLEALLVREPDAFPGVRTDEGDGRTEGQVDGGRHAGAGAVRAARATPQRSIGASLLSRECKRKSVSGREGFVSQYSVFSILT